MSCKPSASRTCHEAGTASPPGPRACRSVPSPGRSRWPPCCCSVADHDQDWWARGQAARTMPGPCQPGLPALRTSLVGTAAARVVPARTAPKADIACRATAEPARPTLPSSSADQCPARRRRVKGGPVAVASSIGWRRPRTRRPLARNRHLSSRTDRTRFQLSGPPLSSQLAPKAGRSPYRLHAFSIVPAYPRVAVLGDPGQGPPGIGGMAPAAA